MSPKLISELSPQKEERASTLFRKAVVIEGLTYAPTLVNPKYLQEIQKSGVTASHITVMPTNTVARETLSYISGWMKLCEEYECRIAYGVQDIYRSKQDGKTCIIMGSQNGEILEDDPFFWTPIT